MFYDKDGCCYEQIGKGVFKFAGWSASALDAHRAANGGSLIGDIAAMTEKTAAFTALYNKQQEVLNSMADDQIKKDDPILASSLGIK